MKVNYYISKCGFQQQQKIFYGFQNGQLVEVVNCQFYVHDQKWTFDEFVEPNEDDTIVGVRKLEIFSFEDHWKSLKTLRFEENI